MFWDNFIENGLNLFFFEKEDFPCFSYVPLGMVFVFLLCFICTLQRVSILTCTVVLGFCIFGYVLCIFAFNVLLHRVYVLFDVVSVRLVNDFVFLGNDFVLL